MAKAEPRVTTRYPRYQHGLVLLPISHEKSYHLWCISPRPIDPHNTPANDNRVIRVNPDDLPCGAQSYFTTVEAYFDL